MPKLSDNQQASLDALKAATQEGVDFVSKAAWKKQCPEGISVHTDAMKKTGAVKSIKTVVSTNGKIVELFAPAGE